MIQTQASILRLTCARLFLAGALFVLSAAGLAADSSVWVVTSGDRTVYLGGTIHLLRPSDFPLPEEFEEAYANSDRLFLETDISGINDPAFLMQMIEKLTYGKEVTLRSVLNEEAIAAVSEYLASLGITFDAVQSFRPGFLATTLEALEFQKMGFEPTGVDVYFNERAISDEKPRGTLEPIEAQISFLSAMGQGYESEYLLMQLQGLKELSAVIDPMVEVWRTGDAEQLNTLFVEEMKREDPRSYKRLVLARNHRWMPIIENLFIEEGTEFVLVGAAHMVGEDGLLRLLEDRGYQVEQY